MLYTLKSRANRLDALSEHFSHACLILVTSYPSSSRFMERMLDRRWADTVGRDNRAVIWSAFSRSTAWRADAARHFRHVSTNARFTSLSQMSDTRRRLLTVGTDRRCTIESTSSRGRRLKAGARGIRIWFSESYSRYLWFRNLRSGPEHRNDSFIRCCGVNACRGGSAVRNFSSSGIPL